MKDYVPTAWMIRRDGLEISVVQHIYGNPDELDETLYAAEWLYNNTAEPETQNLVLQLVAAYGRKLNTGLMHPFRAIARDIRKKSYIFLTEAFVREHMEEIPWDGNFDIDALSAKVIDALNQEFLRARYGGMYIPKPGCRDMYFRISSKDFNWRPVIEDFLYRRRQWIDTVTVVRDEESTGQKYYYRDEKGQPVKRRYTKPIIKELAKQRTDPRVLGDRIYEMLDSARFGNFDKQDFRAITVEAFDYICTYMTGQSISRQDVYFIRQLAELAALQGDVYPASEDELATCRDIARGLLFLIENANYIGQKPSGRVVPIWCTVFYTEEENDDGELGYFDVDYDFDLDDFENEMGKVIKDKWARVKSETQEVL